MNDSKIKVAYILTPITFGGAEKVNLNFLRTVDRDRFDIHPILLIRPWEEESYFASEIHQLGYAYEKVPVAIKTSDDPLRVLRVVSKLYSMLKQGTFNLVHTHGYFADICSLPMARLLGIKSISTCHGFIANDKKLKIYNLLDKYAIRLCNTVIAVSEGIRSELVSSGVKDSRIVVIPNAVGSPCREKELRSLRLEKRQNLSIAPSEFVVGYLGRLSKEKGLNYLVEAAARLHEAANPVKLLIIGDGPERLKLEQQVKDRGVENRVFFAGFQTDIESWLTAFDVFTLPSLTEGTPMALLEAMAMGVPVVATSVGGVPKVVTDGVNGLLVSPGEIEALSKKILLLKNDTELSFRIGKAGIDTISKNYSIDNWCRTIENNYCGI